MAQPAPAAAQIKVKKRRAAVLPFEEFDRLVRREMKRLNVDGRIPGHALWNDQRDEQLPTLSAVMQRYECANMKELAELLGMEEPLGKGRTVKIALPLTEQTEDEVEEVDLESWR